MCTPMQAERLQAAAPEEALLQAHLPEAVQAEAAAHAPPVGAAGGHQAAEAGQCHSHCFTPPPPAAGLPIHPLTGKTGV